MWAPFCKSFLTWALFKVTEVVYVSKSFLHEKGLTGSGLTHFATKFTKSIIWAVEQCVDFQDRKMDFSCFFWKKVLTSASPICFSPFAPQPHWMDGLSLCPCPWAAPCQPRSAPTRCNSPGRVQSEFPFQIWSSSLRPLFHLRLKHILPWAAEK